MFCRKGGGGGREGEGGKEERKDATREPVSVLMLHDVFFFLYCLLLVFPNHVIIQKTRSDINQRDKTASLFHLLHFFE